MIKMSENELCKLKGHMWSYSKRKDVQREDGIYSVATERQCARCGLIEKLKK